ncbi:MAG TPA: glutamyl-tRNA reductase [Dehalococcoidia bacterium]
MAADIVLAGISHKTAPIEIRERLAFGAAELPRALAALRERFGGGVVLSTCNRTEIYVAGRDGAVRGADLLAFLEEAKGVPVFEHADRFYIHHEAEAVRHLCRVAAGIDSMVLGEAQILGQVREAFLAAHRHGALDRTLSRLFHTAVAAGKRARNQTGIARYAVSVSSAGVSLARQVLGDLASSTVLVVSAGEAGKLAARALAGSGVSRVLVTNRSYARAVQVAEDLGGEPVRFQRLAWAMAQADMVITATGADHYLFSPAFVAEAMGSRGDRPLLLIDLAVPRDVDPAVRDLPGVRLFDIDDLQAVSEANLREREREARKAEAIVQEEADRFLGWWRAQAAVPTIAALRGRAEAVRRAELAKTFRRMPDLTEEQRQRIDALTAAIVKKLLHNPIALLKGAEADSPYVDAVRTLFRLDDEPPRDGP